MTLTLSLRARLTLIILGPLLAISIGVAIWAARDAQARAADRFDRSLLVTALGISRDTAFSGGNAVSEETRDLLRDTSGGPVFYHVYAPDGVFVTGYATPPVPPADLAPERYTYFDARYLDRSIRAVRFSDRMNIDGLVGEFTFTVWQDLALRDGFVRSLSRRTYGVMATLVIAVALIVWFGVRLGMGPLIDLEGAIARRSAQDLTPIRRAIPAEVRGIVGRLNDLLSELTATLRAKDEFISNAAHQLRNPISGVLALSEAVAAAPTEAEMRTRNADLTEAAAHAAKLTEDLLALERARSAPASDQLPVQDLGPSLADVLARAERLANPKDVLLRLQGCNAPIPVRIDPTLFEQGVENLVVNALLHGGEGLTEVSVRVSTASQRVEIEISDNGKGLDPDQFDLALSRFAQVSPVSGSGLGLPIAKAVVETAGGDLAMAARDPGLAVTLSLPIAAAPA
ncbi:MAG: sensor histidine kinase [Pseudomonadota bacterium]